MGILKKLGKAFADGFLDANNETSKEKAGVKTKFTIEKRNPDYVAPTLESLKEREKKHQTDIVALHFDYLRIIELLYKKRKEDQEALKECIEYCKKDIELYPKFKKAYDEADKQQIKDRIASYKELGYGKEMYGQLEKELKNFKPLNLRIPAFQQLAIIYEQNKEYKKAIEICELALKYDLEDGTQGGFEGRIERIKKKESK
ncbi:hypothetical protein ABET15_04415 [Heyndrickxia faecalis]|uniref:hypothetical protein n=1 Tax=Heyndrickxia TaxID=2837504 RepID=UPI00223558B5|nr:MULTISPECIES: hypothetical protein [Heyndrickxia]MED4866150.1 hypothetical protein [Weizmannia sp. CD-2023]UZH06365.1 hypothetical protein ONG97_16360 [Heyndrickxia coagulans]UZH06421.1 hypothetical protein ONG97_00315 [Heyndrickxia coagulans]